METAAGFTVDGSLSVKTGEGKRITFRGANVDVRFDANGRLRSISGKVQIPSPHARIAFADPIRADVGVFTGRFLNEHRDLGILLKDDTDYFVFDVGRVGGPRTVESSQTLVAAVQGHGRVAAGKTRVAGVPVEDSTESAARDEKELLIPARRQWKSQLEPVLRRDVPDHLAVLLDRARREDRG